MLGSIRIVTLLLLMAAAQVHAGAGPEEAGSFSKGPHACFAEVCLGDRIEDLSEIALLPAPPLGPPNNSGDRDSRDNYPMMHRKAFGFWDPSLYRTMYEGRFDSRFVPIAARYADFCPQQLERNRHYRLGNFKLTGAYKTDSGLITDVRVDLAPEATDAGLRAQFFVSGLYRAVPVRDSVEGERVVRSVEERYRAYDQRQDRLDVVRARFVSGRGQPRVEISITPIDHRIFGEGHPDWERVARSARCGTGATPGID